MFRTTGAYATRIFSGTTVFSRTGVEGWFSDVERPQPASMNAIATERTGKRKSRSFFMGDLVDVVYAVCGTVFFMILFAMDASKFAIVIFMNHATILGTNGSVSNPPHWKSQVIVSVLPLPL